MIRKPFGEKRFLLPQTGKEKRADSPKPILRKQLGNNNLLSTLRRNRICCLCIMRWLQRCVFVREARQRTAQMCDVPLHTRRIEGTVTLVVSCFAAVTSSFCHWGNPGAGLLDSGQKVIRHRLVLQGLEECKRKAVADHGRGSQYCPRLFVYLPHG